MENSLHVAVHYLWCSATLSILGAAGLAAVLAIYAFKRTPATQKLCLGMEHQSSPIPNVKAARKSTKWKSDKVEDCMKFLFGDCQTLFEVLRRGSRVSRSTLCLGKLNKKKAEYEWITYSEVLERCKNFGSGLLHLGLSPGSLTRIGIFAANSIDYVVAEFAAYNHRMVVVPLYDTLGPCAVRLILNEADIGCALCDSEDRLRALITESDHLKKLKIIIIMGDVCESYKSKAVGYGIKVFTMNQVEEMGKISVSPFSPPKPSDIAVVCYTSGTTGTPKGVMLTHGSIISNLSSVMYQLGDHAPNVSDTYLSFLPLAHMFERCCQSAVLMIGARIGFFSGDVRNLSDDMKALKPTIMPCVPRICNRIYNKTFAVASQSKIKLWLLKRAIAVKTRELEKGIVRSDGFWDRLVFKKVRQGMGDNLRLIVVGAAPMDPDVMMFMRCAIGCIVCEGYGQTECVCPCTLTLPEDCGSSGHVGPPLASAYIKLIDVPEMNYYTENGVGEICVKGPILFQGYLGNKEKTDEAIDHEGWLHTGDIGQWLPNEALKVIDRKKHIFKLSQGEYIAPEKIENVYSRSHFVAQIFVHGESLKSSLVAVVVPASDVVITWGRQHNIRGTLTDLCADPKVKQAILDNLHQVGRKEGLKPFEQVKDILIYPEAFTIDNDLLTPTLKTRRPECRKYFEMQLQELYRLIE